MAGFLDIQKKFVKTLLLIPGMDAFAMRSALLSGLPNLPLVRDQNIAQLDLINIISGLKQLGRLDAHGGARPLVVVADNARFLVPDGSDVAIALDGIVTELNDFYGGEVQPQTPVAQGEMEQLLFGRQRDTRLPLAFLEGALRTSKSIARLRVPRIFNGVPRGGEYVVGTGWMIAPNLLITNHHVIDARDLPHGEAHASDADFKAQAKAVVAWFDYFAGELGPFVEYTGTKLATSSLPLDYAILTLTKPAELAARPPLRLAKDLPALVRGSRLNIAQHAGGQPLRYAIRNNFFVKEGQTSDFIRYQTDTEPGASGSPVCNDDWQVLGLHHSSVAVQAGQVPQEVLDGQPVTVNVLNEAIAITSILNNLPAALKKSILDAQA